MQGVLVAPLAILPHLDTIGIILLVLSGRVITALALGAGQSDQSTHEFSFKLSVSKLASTHRSTSE